MNPGVCSIVQAELWGIENGLHVALTRGFDSVIVEPDSELAIRFLDKGCHHAHPCAPLVREIKACLDRFEHFFWRHVYREANSVANAFAKNGRSLLLPMRIYDSAPSFCLIPLIFDLCNTLYRRA
ncbi:uncharacterized protein LOC130710771 [Lotus japonicus]|uniref:uncharacterized protein LOC130710771 n=1 Tax=Lotus japonicus TaxID=34305 RepID=UPI00258C317D|nr:uncharacterized protein LOC130710771 [Lotus japonicus]